MKGNSSGCRRKESSSYKLWALLAVLALALWSMVSGSVNLKWSVVTGFGSSDSDDLDILEVEEREKVVRHMWDLYGRSKTAKLTRFWREAFEAAYEDLVSDVHGVRDSAFSEIAKMSVFSVALDPLPPQETRDRSRKMGKDGEKRKEVTKIPKKEKKEDVKVNLAKNQVGV